MLVIITYFEKLKVLNLENMKIILNFFLDYLEHELSSQKHQFLVFEITTPNMMVNLNFNFKGTCHGEKNGFNVENWTEYDH